MHRNLVLNKSNLVKDSFYCKFLIGFLSPVSNECMNIAKMLEIKLTKNCHST